MPVGDYTLEEKGSKQVPIIGLEDKRQITVLLGCTISGFFLPPPQVIYAGGTNQVHPKFPFPDDWDITHTSNHWSNSESMCDYVEKIIVPYIENVREKLPLSRSNMSALCIFDVFKAHQVNEFKDQMTRNNVRMRYVPASCTSEVQPLDLAGNDEFKKCIKNQFSEWYADQIQTELQRGKTLQSLNIDLRLSTLKPIHAGWLVKAYQSVRSESLLQGWGKNRNSFTNKKVIF